MKRTGTTRQAWLVVTILVASSVLIGCGDRNKSSDATPAKLTTSQRDSVTAASRLPGAGAVKQALGIADSAAVRAARLNESTK